MVKDAHEKAGDKTHWGMYRLMFGGEGGTYVALSGDPSMSVIDDGLAGQKKYLEAMGGEEGMGKLEDTFRRRSRYFSLRDLRGQSAKTKLCERRLDQKVDACFLEAQGRSGEKVESTLDSLADLQPRHSYERLRHCGSRSFLLGRKKANQSFGRSDHFKLSFPMRKQYSERFSVYSEIIR